MSGQATTPEFEARREWVQRVLGFDLTARDQANAVAAEVLVRGYEALEREQTRLAGLLDGAMVPLRDSAPFGWATLNTDLAGIERRLTNIDAAVVADRAAIGALLVDVANRQAAIPGLIAAAQARQTAVLAALDKLRADIVATCASVPGPLTVRLQALSGAADAAVRPLATAWNLAGAEVAMPAQTAAFTQIQQEIAARFTAAEAALGVERQALNALGALTESESAPDPADFIQATNTAINGAAANLPAAEKAVADLHAAIVAIQQERAEGIRVHTQYNQLQPVLQRIADMTGDDFSDADNAHAIERIQTRITDDLGGIEDDARDNGWAYVRDAVAALARLLAEAQVVTGRDAAAGAAVALAQQAAAAAAALAAQQAAAAAALAAQQANALFQAATQRAIAVGDQNFTAGLLNAIWRKTKEGAPHDTNSGVNGEYSFADIMAAIGQWNGTVLDPGFKCFVPGGGGGRIQDKRSKGRFEVQGNFISDWGNRGTVNVHVNLRPTEWDLVH